MRNLLYAALLCAVAPVTAQAMTCVDPAELAGSVFGITSELEKDAARDAGTFTDSGSAVALGPHLLLTGEHVAFRFTRTEWKTIRITQGQSEGTSGWRVLKTTARIKSVVDTGFREKLYLLELQETLGENIPVPDLRVTPLQANELLSSVVYSNELLRFAHGEYKRIGRPNPKDWGLSGQPLIEMYGTNGFEGDDRYAISHSASGGGVFDCPGRLAGIVYGMITPYKLVRYPNGVTIYQNPGKTTAWGEPNYVMIPVSKVPSFTAN